MVAMVSALCVALVVVAENKKEKLAEVCIVNCPTDNLCIVFLDFPFEMELLMKLPQLET